MKENKTKINSVLHQTPYTRHPSPWFGRTLFAVIVSIFLLVLPIAPALADPHAMFYTDKGQQQVFYNILAALNQADYVEGPPQINGSRVEPPNTLAAGQPTSPPLISMDARIGNYLATGSYEIDQNQINRQATITKDKITVGQNGVAQPLEPLERTNLPRITVRQVTSDNGDAFLRETLQRRALAEQMRVEFSGISCRILEGIYGPQSLKSQSSNGQNQQTSPCDEFLKGDNAVFAR